MRIGIDISSILSKRKTGIGWYTYYLIKNLIEVDKENEYVLFGCSIGNYRGKFNLKGDFNGENLNISVKFLPNKLMSSLHIFFPIEFLHGRFDVIHITLHPYSVLNIFGKQIVTVHDLCHLINSKWFHPVESYPFKIVITKTVQRVDRIIAVSESTKRDLIEYLGVKSEKVEVIYEGVDEIFRVVEDREKIEEVKRRYGISKRYILTVGTIEPKKNHIRLLNVFKRIREKREDYQLVICGKYGWKTERFLERLSGLPDFIRKDIIITEYVRYEDLPLLYNGCDIFIYPSLYEGFGLPIVEAMRCGVPVITSNISSMPEVAGDGAILVNPEDEEEIGNAIIRLIEDRELREELKKKGLERSKMFSWEKTAIETLKVYKELE